MQDLNSDTNGKLIWEDHETNNNLEQGWGPLRTAEWHLIRSRTHLANAAKFKEFLSLSKQT
jgi:hypothetical protein